MFAAILLSFGVIFVAELGDKTQLVAMTFALRYRWWVVISAITVATAVVHVLSVAIGHYLGAALPTGLLGILAGAMFVIFGLWTLRGDKLSDEEASKAQKATAPAFFVVTSAFFLAELGDKTMLATVTLAADNNWIGVWIGSTVGMVAADALAIVVGAVLGKHLPERIIQLAAATLFLLFGFFMLFENVFSSLPVVAIVGMTVAVVAAFGATLRALPDRLRPEILRSRSADDDADSAGDVSDASADSRR